ncbi:MAG: MotA/TolQ/ExbB proton channel family protein [Bdellovibrionaceae bacterium]|nr:MotA/TolQ/ExbB proton channel family protein [Pseudobdellovibrionaceae bacterium]
MDVFLSGGEIMWLLLLQSVLAVSWTVDGFWKFRVKFLAPAAVTALLRDAMNTGNYVQAIQVCQTNPSFISRVLQGGLERLGKGKDTVFEVIASKANDEATRMRSSLNYLSIIGVTAPMLGLLGTVQGIIGAFDTLSKSGVTDMAALSANLSVALVTTAGGLIVAVPAFILYYVVRNEANKAFASVEGEISLLLEDVPYDQLLGMDFRAAAQG